VSGGPAGGRPGAIVRSYDGCFPKIADSAWVAPGAVVVGDVEIGEDSSVWYGVVLRGDVHQIRIGPRTNLQDGAVVHVTAGRFGTTVGAEVTVGHRAVVHGCYVGDGALIGIGAIVLDGASVGPGALVAAGAVVPPGAEIPGGSLAVGTPARVVRSLSEDERELQRQRTLTYVETARKHAAAESR
jgi:carbonic anhydrase/acetyltransferase-like protein (isoleucine patch superfamily)